MTGRTAFMGIPYRRSPKGAVIRRAGLTAWSWTCRACPASSTAPTRREAIEAFYLHEPVHAEPQGAAK